MHTILHTILKPVSQQTCDYTTRQTLLHNPNITQSFLFRFHGDFKVICICLDIFRHIEVLSIFILLYGCATELMSTGCLLTFQKRTWVNISSLFSQQKRNPSNWKRLMSIINIIVTLVAAYTYFTTKIHSIYYLLTILDNQTIASVRMHYLFLFAQ